MTLMIGSSKITPSIFPKNNIKNQDKTITENGVYTADEGYTGLGEVTVDVTGSDKYKVGDRVNDDSNNPVGTVSSIFTDGDGQRYAVVCLDAQYRLASATWCSNNSTTVTGLPIYSTDQWGPWEAKETATYNTQKILDFCNANGYISEACNHCRTLSFTIDGTTYYGQLPNMIEVNDIVKNHTAINTADPTAGSYSSVDFSIGRRSWSSSQCSIDNAWNARYDGNLANVNKTTIGGVVPVLEIPLD